MLRSLEAITSYLQGDSSMREKHVWLRLLAEAEEQIVNLERVESLEQIRGELPVLRYVERSLRLLEGQTLSFWIKELAEEVLVWSETAKGGTLRERKAWQEEGINSFVHNIGSAQLYLRHQGKLGTARELLVHRLIGTHGWIGQQIRGEVPPSVHQPLTQLVTDGVLTAEELRRLLIALNHCIIGAVSLELWAKVQQEVEELIAGICSGTEGGEWPIQKRLSRMRSGPIAKGENFPEEWRSLMAEGFHPAHLENLESMTFWYVEAALQTFSLEQFVKIMLLAADGVREEEVRHISFEPVMQGIYYDFKGRKRINVYKKRIIEKYLSGLTWSELADGTAVFGSPHLSHVLRQRAHLSDTRFFEFQFSPAAEKLIEFCIEAEKSPLYERAVLMLFDLFELRRDAFDRFHNEDDYLRQMNGTADYKAVILEHVNGRKVLDIGPGGGVLLDLLEERMPDVIPVGIDISSNVIEALQQKKQREGRRWEVLQGDALNLKEYVTVGSVDTVIFSSILHELYSYVPLNGKKFNHDTIAAALRSSFDVLSPGGVMIIRDGIMTEPETGLRRLTFLETDGMMWLKRYAKDFQGRKIRYETLNDQEVIMPVNDAMEFLYTYTWGPEAYVHEVQEQFGYFTPSAYTAFIEETLGERARLEVFRHYLQEGYTEALQTRVRIGDEKGRPVPLPDSTCFIVIRKKED